MIAGPGFALSVVALVATGYLVVVLFRRRSMPAASPLLAFALLIAGYLLVHTSLYVPGPLQTAFESLTGQTYTFEPYLHFQAILTGVGGALWFLFALQYTGRGERLVVTVGTVLVSFWTLLFGVAGLAWVRDIRFGGEPLYVPLFSVGLFSMTALLIVGTMLVIETAWQRNAVGLGEAGLLFTGGVTFSVTSLASGMIQHSGVPTAMILLTSLQFLVVVHRYPVFDALPLVRVAGRDRFVEKLEDAVLVTDRDEYVRDINERAETTFDISRADARGEPLEEILPQPVDIPRVVEFEDDMRIQTPSGAMLAVTVDRVTDDRDRWFGYVIQCTDVTERQQRERRLSVLHQLLTGSLTDRLSEIADEADRLATAQRGRDRGESDEDTSEPPPEAVGDTIIDSVTELKTLVARARELERALEATDTERVAVTALVESVLADERGEGTVDTPGDEATATVDPDVLRCVLELLLDDVDTAVEIAIETPPHGPEIHLVTESATFDNWTATVTRELVRLAIESVGGTVSTVTTAQTAIVVRLPPAESSAIQGIQSSESVNLSADGGHTPNSVVDSDRGGESR